MPKEMTSNEGMTPWREVPSKRDLRNCPVSPPLLSSPLLPASPLLSLSPRALPVKRQQPQRTSFRPNFHSHSPLNEGHWWSVEDSLLRGRLHSPNTSPGGSCSKCLHGEKRPHDVKRHGVESKACGIWQTGILNRGWTLWPWANCWCLYLSFFHSKHVGGMPSAISHDLLRIKWYIF